MSSYVFYKIPYEGSLKKVKELIEEREWDFQIKVPKDGIILVRIPPETEEELNFDERNLISIAYKNYISEIHKNIPNNPELGQYLLELSLNKYDIYFSKF